jgi:excinuclease UvrABC helicase subunit UvrB
MPRWKQQLEKYNSLLEQIVQRKEKNEGELRFNRCTIRASDVAGQYYCERKVEMEYLYGEVETRLRLVSGNMECSQGSGSFFVTRFGY